MKRIICHALSLFSLAFVYTKGTLLSTLLYFIPVYATAMILGFFTLLPYLSDTTQTPHDALYWRVGYAKAIHKGDWRLDFNEKENFMNLRNLRLDPYETQNLAQQYPDRVNALK